MLEPTPFDKELREATKWVNRLLKRTQSRTEKQRTILEGCENWEETAHEAQLLQANLYRINRREKSIEVEDWLHEGKKRTLELDPLVDPHLQVAKLYKQAKKLKAGIPYAKKQLAIIEAELQRALQAHDALGKVKSPEELQIFCKEYAVEAPALPKSKKEHKEPPKPYYEFQSASGLTIWVGRNAKGNDALTFHYANGSDWWLHAHLYPGSHVVIRTKKGEEPDPATLSDAAELALRYSKAKDLTEGEVTLSQVKYLKRVKNSPGTVTLSWHKILYVKKDKARWESLKARA